MRMVIMVLLPQPLPPMMMKTSPRLMVKVRSRMRTKSPYAMVRSWTLMWASFSVMVASSRPTEPVALPFAASGSYSQHVAQHGDHRGGDDDPHNGGDHRGRGRVP